MSRKVRWANKWTNKSFITINKSWNERHITTSYENCRYIIQSCVWKLNELSSTLNLNIIKTINVLSNVLIYKAPYLSINFNNLLFNNFRFFYRSFWPKAILYLILIEFKKYYWTQKWLCRSLGHIYNLLNFNFIFACISKLNSCTLCKRVTQETRLRSLLYHC